MKRLFFILAFLSFIFLLFADYVPQCLLINSYDQIEIVSQDPNSLVTNCGWFNVLSKQYQIDYLHEMFSFNVNQSTATCYYIKYKDTSISVDSLMNVFSKETAIYFSEPNYYAQLYSDPLRNDQWGLDKISMQDVWDNFSYYGDGIKVGIIDTGIDLGLNHLPNLSFHPDLLDNIYDDGNNHHGYNAYGVETGTQDQYNLQDDYGHGTLMAGVIGARTNNGIGIAGIAGGDDGQDIDGCSIYSIKVGGTQLGDDIRLTAIIDGITHAYNDGVRIFNCSFGIGDTAADGDTTPEDLDALITRLSTTQDAALFICAAGNSGQYETQLPARNPYVISVAATDQDDRRAGYSSIHRTVSLAAPGGMGNGVPLGILTTTPQSGEDFLLQNAPFHLTHNYSFAMGTSLSAPMVTGAVVLVKEAYPTYTMQQIKARIIGTTDDISQANPEREVMSAMGSGRLNIYHALRDDEYASVRLDHSFINSPAGSQNHIACGDQNISITVMLKNWWVPSTGGITGFLSTDDPNITFLPNHNSLSYPVIGAGEITQPIGDFVFNDSSIIPTDVIFKLTLAYDDRYEEIYFKVERRMNSAMGLRITDRTPESDLIIDDMDNDGVEEIALLTSHNGIGYIDLLVQGEIRETHLDHICSIKPAFADMNEDGIKELVVVDNDNLTIYSKTLTILYQHSFINAPVHTYAIEDLNNDGRLDIAVGYDTANQGTVLFLLMGDRYVQEECWHSLSAGYYLFSNFAIGNVDPSACNDVLYLEKKVTVSQVININLEKLTYVEAKGSAINAVDGNVININLTTFAPSDLSATDLILSMPHPDEVGALNPNFPKRSYIYFGIGYHGQPLPPTLDNFYPNYKTYCYDFWNNSPLLKWEHNFMDDTCFSGYVGLMSGYNIIAGDFIPENPGVEILTGASEEVLDSETGEFIQFLTNHIVHAPYNLGDYYVLNHYQPAVIEDFENDGVREVMMYKNNQGFCYDANQNPEAGYSFSLPTNIKSLVAGKAFDITNQEIYALCSDGDNTIVHNLILNQDYSDHMFEWRQFNNNGRKTSEFYQPLPVEFSYDLMLWNNTELQHDCQVDDEGRLNIDEGVHLRLGKDMHLKNKGGVFCISGTENNRVVISGLCKKTNREFWKEFTNIDGARFDATYLNFSNAAGGISAYDCRDFSLKHSKFTANSTAILAYDTPMDFGYDNIAGSANGTVSFHDSNINMGFDSGHNNIQDNTEGLYLYKGMYYLDTGYNNFDNIQYNIYSTLIPDPIKAQYNWWGSADEHTFILKFNNPDDVTYDCWSLVENPIPNKNNNASDFQIAENLRLTDQWSMAIPYYESVIADSVLTLEDYQSATGLFQCYQLSKQTSDFKDWLNEQLANPLSTSFGKQLENLLALTNRALNDYQPALDYYESILDSNPDYVDSCFAVIDIGFTWLEAGYSIRGKHNDLIPKSLPDQLVKADMLLKSILKNDPIDNQVVVPMAVSLSQNYPNPFNPSTTIEFGVPKASKVSLRIYNIKGQLVKELVNQNYEPGKFKAVWEGKNDLGKKVASGVYFYRLEAGKTCITHKMLLLK